MTYFSQNLFRQNNCKDAMNIGGVQIRGALFNFFEVKKCPIYIFQSLPSVSKITPGITFFLPNIFLKPEGFFTSFKKHYLHCSMHLIICRKNLFLYVKVTEYASTIFRFPFFLVFSL